MNNNIPIYNTYPLLSYAEHVTTDSDIQGHIC